MLCPWRKEMNFPMGATVPVRVWFLAPPPPLPHGRGVAPRRLCWTPPTNNFAGPAHNAGCATEPEDLPCARRPAPYRQIAGIVVGQLAPCLSPPKLFLILNSSSLQLPSNISSRGS